MMKDSSIEEAEAALRSGEIVRVERICGSLKATQPIRCEGCEEPATDLVETTIEYMHGMLCKSCREYWSSPAGRAEIVADQVERSEKRS